jgi:TATA-binding protein-associated factor
MKLYGVECLSIDGSMSFEKRDKIVAKFNTDDASRVLIFSSVGSAGLNLSIACKILLFVS